MSLAAILLVAGGCDTPAPGPCAAGFQRDPGGGCVQSTARPALIPLEGPPLLRRLSLDLRGVLPSVADLDAVEADPDGLPGLRDAYLEDPAFEERLVSLLGETWYTLVDDVTIQVGEVGLPMDQQYRYVRSVGEEPLRLMAHVAAGDRPFSEIVTADYTLANETLAALWPLDYPEGATGWQVARYTDDRPAAGVLSTNGLWWRYTTNQSNANRGRAAAIARLLLCFDYLARPVSFEGGDRVLDAAGTAAATQEDPSCVTCHASLDPMAASLFGFWWFEEHQLDEMSYYHASREPLGESVLGVSPGWFGEPTAGLGELGLRVADDVRFPRCMATTLAGTLWHRPVEVADFDQVNDLTIAFEASDLRLKALLAAITDGETYRAGDFTGDAGDDALARELPRRMLTADQLSSALEDLTGFLWTWEGFSRLHDDTAGFRILAGGVDGTHVRTPQRDPGLTWALTTKRIAEAAASHAVAEELVAGGERRLFANVDLSSRPGDEAFATELARLHWRLHAQRPSDARLVEDEALWTELEASSGATAAWSGLVSVLLRDPDFLTY